MQLKLYQLQVAGGCICALALGLVQHQASPPLLQCLQTGDFFLCCAGVVTASRALRQRYAALGASRTLAVRDPGYMAERLRVQIAAMFATSAIAMVLASRYDIDVLLTGLVVLIAGVAAIPLINRIRGWVASQ